MTTPNPDAETDPVALPTIKVFETSYQAAISCDSCDYHTAGTDVRLAGINHVKQSGHTITARVRSTEKIKPAWEEH